MLVVSYSLDLVAASIGVAAMAAFTSLRLTSGLSAFRSSYRKIRISQAAVALGGGIWSMHFVGMLAVQLPIPILYDPLRTMGSALIAVLMTGTALIFLHFGRRTRSRILLAGAVTGCGISSMHYLGMSAISGNCMVTYAPAGILISLSIAILASSFAMHLAYTRRTLATTLLGSVVLGLAISAMHYSAMAYTMFYLVDEVALEPARTLSTDSLALVVAFAAFLICGLFLLTAVPGDGESAAEPGAGGTAGRDPLPAAVEAAGPDIASQPAAGRRAAGIPYERDRTVRYLSPSSIHYVQAKGHYTEIIDGDDAHFCPWPISRVAEALGREDFIRTHRSYLVNANHVRGFRREGDGGRCLVGAEGEREVPVSRSRIPAVQERFGA